MTDRDAVHNYRPGPASEAPLEPGETVQAVFAPDKARYWRDHINMGGIALVAVTVLLFAFGRGHTIWAGVLGVFLALGFRALFLKSEVFARRWQLTDRRLIGPQGRQVFLLEIKEMRKLWGDVQIVTNGGDKHLIKHLADAQGAVDAIEVARNRRAARHDD